MSKLESAHAVSPASPLSEADVEGILGLNGALDEAAVRLAFAPETLESPREKVKRALFKRVRKSLAKAPPRQAVLETDHPGWRFASLNDKEGWLRTPFKGIRVKEMLADQESDIVMIGVEVQPGVKVMDHDHDAPERGIIVSGNLYSGGRCMEAGTFFEGMSGTRHEGVVSPDGCTGLLFFKAQTWAKWRPALMLIN